MAKLNCSCGKQKDDCCPFRKIVIPAVMGDDSEDSPSAPENGAYVNALVEYEANGAMYMYASDGIFTKLSMVAGGAGAASISYVDTQDAKMLADAKTYADSIVPTIDVTKAYVDQQDAKTLADAKTYADSIAPTVDVTKAYVDQQDANILAEAKAYTDEHSPDVSQQYVDEQDEATLSSAQSYADAKDTVTLSSAKSYTDTEVANTLQNAKDYADGIGDTTLASANEAISTAIAQANVPVFTVSNVDISEGSALPANNFYGVYIEGSK